MRFSKPIELLSESATLAVSRRARALQAEGRDVVSFGAGQPDFPTPQHITKAAQAALDAGHTGYAVPSSGLAIAKRAICHKFKTENHLTYDSSQVIVTVGGKEALFLAFMVLVDEGDEVLIPSPYWVSYPEQVKLARGKVVVIDGPQDNGFRITPAQLEASLTDRTRVLLLNYPSNPGGYSYSRAQLEELAAVLSGREVTVFCDEMYDRLIYGDQTHVSWATLSDETYGKTLTFNAVSKSYAMTGWRLGYAAGPANVIAAMAKLQSHTTSGAANFAQHGLVAALEGNQECVEKMRQEYERRGRFMYERLCALPGVTCVEPTGAFYCFPNVSATYQRLGVKGSVEFAGRLPEEAHVAVVPGVAFGCDQNVRLSYALGDERIAEGLDRLEKFLST